MGSAIALNHNRSAVQPIPDEIANREVDVQRQVRAHKSKTASDPRCDPVLLRKQRAQSLSGPLSLPIGRARISRVRRTGVVLGDVGHARGLPAIDCARAGQQELPHARVAGKLQGAAGSVHDCIEHGQRLVRVQLYTRLRGRMDDVRKAASRKTERAYVAGVKLNGRMVRQMGSLLPECIRVSRQDQS